MKRKTNVYLMICLLPCIYSSFTGAVIECDPEVVILEIGGMEWKYNEVKEYGNLIDKEAITVTSGGGGNVAPIDITLSPDKITEKKPTYTEVGTFSTVDNNGGDTHDYTLVSGDGDTDNDNFQITGDKLQTKVTFDYEAPKQNCFIRVRTTENNTTDYYYWEVELTIEVVDTNADAGLGRIVETEGSDTVGEKHGFLVAGESVTEVDKIFKLLFLRHLVDGREWNGFGKYLSK